MTATRSDRLRKRLAPLAFLLAVGLLARETCDRKDRRTATFVLRLGAAEPRVRALEARLYADPVPPSPSAADVVGALRRAALPGARIGVARFQAALPAPDGELHLDVELDGEVRRVVRRFHAEEGGVVTVDLERDLR